VATELQSLLLHIEADPRLAAAAGGVVRYLAEAAGFENDAIARLQLAVIAACSEAFEHLSADHPQLQITFTRFSDRMEVALSHLGEDSPAVGLDTIAGFAAQVGGTGSIQVVLAGFDRVQYETHGGEAVTRLTKYIGQVARDI
jgi:anti-sigma regulatory factor (Ser/Thr protein kinase)